jgi:hypothetical protein
MYRQNQRFVIWWKHEGVSVADWKACAFFNKHALFMKEIYFIEFYVGQELPKDVDLLLP